jgi:hypothetical protein
MLRICYCCTEHAEVTGTLTGPTTGFLPVEAALCKAHIEKFKDQFSEHTFEVKK